jgi:hypothetical protein
MSLAPTESEQESASTADRAAQDMRPWLPFVLFSWEEPRLKVFYAARDAAFAAQASPKGEFFDLRGRRLAPAKDGSEPPRLEALAEGTPAKLQRRVMDELRRAAESEALDGGVAAEVEAALRWLNRSPDVAYTVHALGLAQTDPGAGPDPLCKGGCTTMQKLNSKNNCCP